MGIDMDVVYNHRIYVQKRYAKVYFIYLFILFIYFIYLLVCLIIYLF